MPAWLLPAIAAGAQVVSSWMSNKATGNMNEDTRNWNEKMYQWQRSDALKDWDAQNKYNSPAQMMQRFREANLNPNLVYGNGATTTAGPVRSTDVKTWNPQPKDYSGYGQAAVQGLSAYQDMRMRDEQVANLQAQRKNMELDSVLKSIQMSSDQIKNSRNSLELAKAHELYDTSIATAQEQLRSLSTGTDIKIDENVRRAAMQAPNLAAAFERVAQISQQTALAKQQLSNLQKTGVLQKMEIDMRKLGLSYSDGVVLRMLAQFAQGQSLPEVVQNLWSKLQRMLKDFGGPMHDETTITPK